MDDDLCVFGQLPNFHLQQLGSTSNSPSGFLISWAGTDQFLVGLRLVHQALFAVLAACCSCGNLDNRLAWHVGLGHHHMYRLRIVVQTAQPRVVA
jgi:hypothetical protein